MRTVVLEDADVLSVRETTASLESVYFDVMGVTARHVDPGRIHLAILRREFLDCFRNRLLVLSIVAPPAIITADADGLRGGRKRRAVLGDPPELIEQLVASHPRVGRAWSIRSSLRS